MPKTKWAQCFGTPCSLQLLLNKGNLVLDFESEWTKETKLTLLYCVLFRIKLFYPGTYNVHLQAKRAGSESLRPSSREP